MASLRHERRIAAPADVVWEVVRRPESITEWFPGIVSCPVDGRRRTVTTATGMEMVEEILTIDDTHPPLRLPDHVDLVHHHLGIIDVIELGPNDSLCVYSTTAEPDPLALLDRGRHRRRPRRDQRRRADAGGELGGTTDPLHHDRPAALRHPRRQRRALRAHAGARRPRRAGHPLRAVSAHVGRVHAVAGLDAHRPVPLDPRRVDERRAARDRRALGRRGAARRRLRHRPDRQGPLRAVPGPLRPLRRERAGQPGRAHGRAALVRRSPRRAPRASTTWSSRPTASWGRCTTRSG